LASSTTPLEPDKPKKKKIGFLKIILIIACTLIALAIIGNMFKKDKPAGEGSSLTSYSSSIFSSVPVSATNVSPTKPNVDVPKEYLSALKKAEIYSQTMHMSKVAIYDQLVSEYGENFAEDAAQYAIDNIKADWNANALAKAETYSKQMNMSKAAIYDQLVSEHGEKFTEKEAQYAVDNLVADYKANALAKAKIYQEQMAMSLNAIRDQLTSEYGEKFTEEEANYAIENLD